VVDLDHFKEINDSLGHSVGDDLLKEVASRLRRCLRPTDSAARLGGDEFAILGRYLTNAAEAVVLGQRLLAAISEPYVVDGIPLHVEASVGVAVAPEHAEKVDQLLQLVDVALYQAKGTGRNRVCLYDPLSDSSSAERFALMAQLRAGMEHELVLFYQPQCSARTGELVGIEALVRWQHPQLGLPHPNDSFPVRKTPG
jgi:diguanylate cyclase (GGDEF)-like protein